MRGLFPLRMLSFSLRPNASDLLNLGTFAQIAERPGAKGRIDHRGGGSVVITCTGLKVVYFPGGGGLQFFGTIVGAICGGALSMFPF